jgi:hypothetical protein
MMSSSSLNSKLRRSTKFRNKSLISLALLALIGMSTLSAKKTYKLEEKPMVKAPRVQKYDCRECLFDDDLNYACLEHSIDIKAGWEIK